MNAQRKPRAVRSADLGRVLDVLAARGWTPHAVKVSPDGSVHLADAPFELALDAAPPPPVVEPNDFD